MKVGKVPESVLKRAVLKQIKTKRNEIMSGAGVGEDCAVFMLPDGDKLAACMQGDGLRLEGLRGEEPSEAGCGIGRLIVKAANNLAAAGAEPIGAELALFLSDDWEEPDLRRLTEEAERACGSLHMQLAGGHTCVVSAATAAFAAVTGYGRISPAEDGITAGKAHPGQDIVVSKWIGLEGTAELARTFRRRLCDRFPAWLVNEAAAFDRYVSIVPEAATAGKSGVRAMHDASGGGIFAALWELAERSGTGLVIDLKKLPIRQETVEVCECCEVNPYELLSGGCLVMAADDGEALVTALGAEQIPAAVVGRVTPGRDRIVRNGEETRFLERPKTDEIYRMREPALNAPVRDEGNT